MADPVPDFPGYNPSPEGVPQEMVDAVRRLLPHFAKAMRGQKSLSDSAQRAAKQANQQASRRAKRYADVEAEVAARKLSLEESTLPFAIPMSQQTNPNYDVPLERKHLRRRTDVAPFSDNRLGGEWGARARPTELAPQGLRPFGIPQEKKRPTPNPEALPGGLPEVSSNTDQLRGLAKMGQNFLGEGKGGDMMGSIGNLLKASQGKGEMARGIESLLGKEGMASLGGEAALGPIAVVAEIAKMKAQAMKESLAGAGKNLTGALNSEKAGDIGGNVFGFGENVSKLAGGGEQSFLSNLFQFGKGLSQSVEDLRKWNDGLHESNMKFAEFSHSMAVVQAEQQVREIELSIKRGERRADSAKQLAEGKNKLDKELAPIEDFWANGKSQIGGMLSVFAADMVKKLKEEFGFGDKEEERPERSTAEIMDQIRKEELENAKRRRPPRMRPGV